MSEPLGTAGTPPPRQYRTIDDLADLLRADFAVNGIGAVVEADVWQPEWHKGEPRVVVGYDTFTFESPRGTNQPGWSVEIPDGSGDVARAILDDCTRFHVWCHHSGEGLPGGDLVPVKARRAVKDLLANTVRAIFDALATGFREPPVGHWPKPREQAPDYPAFTYGSFVEFQVMIPSSVLSGRLHVATVGAVDFTDSIDIDGNVSPEGNDQVQA